MFYVGQKVVCIRGGWDELDGIVVPNLDSVYTIRSIEVGDDGSGDLFLRFVEIVNRKGYYRNGYGEAAFWAPGFRPVVERKTDISIFKAMLNPSDERVDA